MTSALDGGVVVSNAGSLPCLTSISAGLAGAGVIRTYYTPFGGTQPPRTAFLPGRIRDRVARETRRRRLGEPFAATPVEHPAMPAELLQVALRRAGLSAQRPALRLRNAWFDRAVAAQLRGDDAAVIGAYTASEHTIRRARTLTVPSILYYPSAPHGFAERTLREEAKLAPAFASTLSYHNFPRWRLRQLEAELMSADAVVVLSSFQREAFVEDGIDPARIHVVNLGVDLELFRPRERRDDGTFRVVFCGRVTQQKGLSYLLEAFEEAAIPASELLLIGNPTGDALQKIRCRNVRHVPHVPRWELPELYASADVFVLPSLLEGFAQTPLEAMACGLPVIVSENTFGDGVVEDGLEGFVVPIRDADALCERLRRLHDDPGLRAGMGAAAGLRAKDFSWKRSAETMVGVLERVVAGMPAETAMAPARHALVVNS